MISRYSRKEMRQIWSDENKYGKWLKVELAFLGVKQTLGMVSGEAVGHIAKNAKFSVKRIEEIDKEIEHDMNAFIMAVQENLDPKFTGEFHKLLTSYDIEEPSLAFILLDAIKIIKIDVESLMYVIYNRAKEHRQTIILGRTHGQPAQLTTFGLKLLVWFSMLGRDLGRIKQAEEAIKYTKLSGAVGTYDLDPKVEELTLRNLGLQPISISTQIILRDIHAQLISALAICGATIENISRQIWLLSQPEIGEAREPFKKKQKGSSAMPHKKNPVICERLFGQARMLRANLSAAIENIVSFGERDISHSSVERIIFPDSFLLLDYMLDKMKWVIEGLEIFPERMKENIEKTYGTIFSQQVKVMLLEKGMPPEEVYRKIQEYSFEAINTKAQLKYLLCADPEVSKFASSEEIKKCFWPENQLKNIHHIFKRFGIKY